MRGSNSPRTLARSAPGYGGGKSLYPYSGSMPGMPPDEHMLALCQVDQLRTDMAQLEAGQEFLMQQINRLRPHGIYGARQR